MTSPVQGAHRRGVAGPAAALGPGLSTIRDGHWQIVSAPAHCAAGEDLGLPGPWRVVERGCAVAELSPAWLASDDVEGARAALLHWAAATAGGVLPEGAPVAPVEFVTRVTVDAGLSIGAGARALVAQVVHAGPRLSLRAVLGRAPADLSPARAAWLAELLADARGRWRLVRVGVDGGTGEVRTEVDLSGAPPELLGDLLRHGLAALRHVTAWMLPGVDLCLDRALTSALLDHPPAGRVPDQSDPAPLHGEQP